MCGPALHGTETTDNSHPKLPGLGTAQKNYVEQGLTVNTGLNVHSLLGLGSKIYNMLSPWGLGRSLMAALLRTISKKLDKTVNSIVTKRRMWRGHRLKRGESQEKCAITTCKSRYYSYHEPFEGIPARTLAEGENSPLVHLSDKDLLQFSALAGCQPGAAPTRGPYYSPGGLTTPTCTQ